MPLYSNGRANHRAPSGNTCDRCKRKFRTRNLQIHHKDRDPENNRLKNLRVLCKRHHIDLHRKAKRRKNLSQPKR
ncbi:MAG: HNH endonuclease [Dehalococcoidia bacterium]|nr:HNH endonuclease [Dehalococcoidia bacterium]